MGVQRLSQENNFSKTKSKTKFSYNLASGFGKNPKWEDVMQELNPVVGPEVGPLLKLTKNGKTVQDPGLIHEKEMLQDIVKNPEVALVQEVNRRKGNHPTKSIKN